MTATDELRSLLDELGIEWDGESYEGVTFWNDDTNLAIASNDRDGLLWVSQRLTPEQAVTATLGAGACRTVYLVEISDDLLESWYTIAVYQCREAAESRAEALRRKVDGVRHFARVSKLKVVDAC